MIAYLEEEVSRQYLGLLSSRWAALVPRMAKRTQTLQKDSEKSVTHTVSTSRELDDDFRLANHVLDSEHAIYAAGVELVYSTSSTSESSDGAEPPLTSHMTLFLQSMLSELCAKEAIMADWQANRTSLSPDTLRVYAYALLTHPAVRASEVERLLALARHANTK